MFSSANASARSNMKSGILVLACGFLLLAFSPVALPQEHDAKDMSGMQDMTNMPGADDSSADKDILASALKRAADKRESEFNHHLAGSLLVLAGFLALAHISVAEKSRAVRYAWPLCFFAAGLFLLVFSDTEIWPFGPQSFWFAVTHDPEDLQHKLFALILLLLGYVELQRSRGKLKAGWSAWVFPVVGLAGAIMLLFHSHSGGMHGPNHMVLMRHIQFQHRWYAAVGFGIVTTKGVSDARTRWQRIFVTAWPVLLIVLGASLMLYTE